MEAGKVARGRTWNVWLFRWLGNSQAMTERGCEEVWEGQSVVARVLSRQNLAVVDRATLSLFAVV